MKEIIRKGNVVTRLTVNKDRITIKLAPKDDSDLVIDFLTKVAESIQSDDSIRVTMRGALEGSQIEMQDDLNAISKIFSYETKN
jgi:hypothetical protein